MDLDWLESFLALADAGSFTEAAARQHVSQPAFSRRIRALEHWVGTDLVDRSTYPAGLTVAGQRLRRQASGWIEELRELREEVRGRALTPVGAVRVATSHSLATAFFPQWWQQFVVDGSTLPCVLRPSNTHDAYDALFSGGCDLLLTYIDPTHPVDVDPGRYEFRDIGSDIFAPYSQNVDGRPRHSLPGSKSAPVPLVSYAVGAFFGRIVDDLIGSATAWLRPYCVSDLATALRSMALGGAGIAWLPGILGQGSGLVFAGGEEWCRPLAIRLYRPKGAGEHDPRMEFVWNNASSL